ncbi:MAG TPA: pyridoxamine 5'-phosphate oxidase family protein [Pseudonocardiaceae bacterium]|jgi:hypothetical protein|nr:pyridoxamine 5'-phosphate oxidase family protein [Pseudonocardiaceae bacterium]
MSVQEPVAELDSRYSEKNASPLPWIRAKSELAEAELFWLTTVRADGRPHVTPLIAVWLDHGLYVCSGPGEQKVRNLAGNAHCALTTGNNTLNEGLDLVVEGLARQVGDTALLTRLATEFESKYGADWRFTVRDGALDGGNGPVLVFEIAPVTAYGFSKGPYAHTRWRF